MHVSSSYIYATPSWPKFKKTWTFILLSAARSYARWTAKPPASQTTTDREQRGETPLFGKRRITNQPKLTPLEVSTKNNNVKLAIDYPPALIWPTTEDEVLFLCLQDRYCNGGVLDEVD